MSAFLSAFLAFPTVVFSILLGVVVAYWLMVIIGALGIDVLDVGGDIEGFEGALDGAGEAAGEAAAEAIGEAAAEALGEAAGEAAGEAFGEAMGDAAGEAVGEGLEGGGEGAGGGLASLFSALKIGKAPLTVILSLLVFVAWSVSILAAPPLQGLVGSVLGRLVVGIGVMAGSFVVSMVVTSVLMRPISKLFVTHGASRKDAIVGRVCTIKTGRVDERFGQAVFSRHGDERLIPVRCETPNTLGRGSLAVIVDYDARDEVFLVKEAEEIMRNLDDRGRPS